jgi:hypothetical protein
MYYYFYTGEQHLSFNTLDAAFKAAKHYGLKKIRDNLGGEYYL